MATRGSTVLPGRYLLEARKPKGAKPSSLVFANGEGGRPQNRDRETKALMKASGTSGWTRHDLPVLSGALIRITQLRPWAM
jgi:hypothetical protein